MPILNKPPDISEDFFSFDNTYYLADELTDFDPATGQGHIICHRHRYAAFLSFNSMTGENIFGLGEQYGELNKRGQKLHLFTDDARGSQNDKSHKPVPFFLSNKGYGMFVRDGKGSLPYEDAILDLTNPETISWYQGKLRKLLEMGVAAIKADFGEAAPL